MESEWEKEKLRERKEKLEAKAQKGNVTAIQILQKMEQAEKIEARKQELMSQAVHGKPETNVDHLAEVPALNLDRTVPEKLKDLDITEIERYIRKGEFESLPEHMAVYLKWMEIAHDWYYKFKDKNWIVKHLMAVCKDVDGNAISYYLANKVFVDMLSFFYSDKDFRKNSWLMYLAERAMMGAALAWEMNDFETYRKSIDTAAGILEKVKIDHSKMDPRLLDRRPRFFLTDAKQLGLPPVDRNALARAIDEMPVPEKTKLRVKQDLGTEQRNMLDGDTLKDEMEESK